MSSQYVVVFLRHGHSEWNLGERFTGWPDIALTETGIAEAEAAGRCLAAAGYAFDEAHVSLPRIKAGRRLLVVSHGNTLRDLVMHLGQISSEAVEKVEIASAVPLVYRFSARLELLGQEWLE